MDLVAPYPNLEQVLVALETHLPERTKRYSRNILNPASGESWLRSVLMTGELIKLQPDSSYPPITVAVHPSRVNGSRGSLKISSEQFSAARRSLGIDRHWMLVFDQIAFISRILRAADECPETAGTSPT
jgi:hypothetical protein